MTILIQIIKNGKKKKFKIKKLPVYLGSGNEKDILNIEESGNSSKQLKISQSNNGSFLISKMVEKDVYLNGKKIIHVTPLSLTETNKIKIGDTNILVKLTSEKNIGVPQQVTGHHPVSSHSKYKYIIMSLWVISILALGYYLVNKFVLSEAPVKSDIPLKVENVKESVKSTKDYNVRISGDDLSKPGNALITINISDKTATIEDLKNYLIHIRITEDKITRELPVFTVNSPNKSQNINVKTVQNNILVTTQVRFNNPGMKNISAIVTRPKDKVEITEYLSLRVNQKPESEIIEYVNIPESVDEEEVVYQDQPEIQQDIEDNVVVEENETINKTEESDNSPNIIRAKWDYTGLLLDVKSAQDTPFEIEDFTGKNTTAKFKQITNYHYEIAFENLDDIPLVVELKIKGFKRPYRIQK